MKHPLFVDMDQWLSRCLEIPCYRVVNDHKIKLTEILERRSPIFITAKLNIRDQEGALHLQNLGFKKINNQLTYKLKKEDQIRGDFNCKLQFKQAQASILFPEISDHTDLFSSDRFASDHRLPKSWSRIVKTEWLNNRAPAKNLIIAFCAEKIAGYLLFEQKKELIIDLIAVLPDHRTKGVGKSLLLELKSFSNDDFDIIVGTQDTNNTAQKLYESSGFELLHIKSAYHYYQGD